MQHESPVLGTGRAPLSNKVSFPEWLQGYTHTHSKESMVSATFRLRAGQGVIPQSAEDKAESNHSKQT